MLVAEEESWIGSLLGRMFISGEIAAESGESAMLPGLTEVEGGTGGFMYEGHFTNGEALVKILDQTAQANIRTAIRRDHPDSNALKAIINKEYMAQLDRVGREQQKKDLDAWGNHFKLSPPKEGSQAPWGTGDRPLNWGDGESDMTPEEKKAADEKINRLLEKAALAAGALAEKRAKDEADRHEQELNDLNNEENRKRLAKEAERIANEHGIKIPSGWGGF